MTEKHIGYLSGLGMPHQDWPTRGRRYWQTSDYGSIVPVLVIADKDHG
jgi:hypothetical protein